MKPWPHLQITLHEIPADASLKVRANLATCHFGLCLIALADDFICQLAFVDSPESAICILHDLWPQATMDMPGTTTQALADLIFSPRANQTHDLTLAVRGTAFQIKVWKALLRIPHGRTVSYQELATMAGHPTATRAVGSAIGHNPIDFLIPCHRVIRKDGQLGHYHWGPELKRAILEREKEEVKR